MIRLADGRVCLSYGRRAVPCSIRPGCPATVAGPGARRSRSARGRWPRHRLPAQRPEARRQGRHGLLFLGQEDRPGALRRRHHLGPGEGAHQARRPLIGAFIPRPPEPELPQATYRELSLRRKTVQTVQGAVKAGDRAGPFGRFGRFLGQDPAPSRSGPPGGERPTYRRASRAGARTTRRPRRQTSLPQQGVEQAPRTLPRTRRTATAASEWKVTSRPTFLLDAT
jgi:hypothetical protein